MTRTAGQSFFAPFAASFLILAAPFLAFADNAYRILSPGTGAVVLGLAVIAAVLAAVASLKSEAARCAVYAVLLAYFVDLEFEIVETSLGLVIGAPVIAFAAIWLVRAHATAILVAIFGVINLSTLVVSGLAEPRNAGAADAGPIRADLPVLVHLVLDEHIGVDGIPRDAPGAAGFREWLIDSLVSEGFYVVGRAYANHALTRYSIPATLNFTTGESPVENSAQHAEALRIDGNRYFSHLQDKGYRLSIYQSDYLDFCAGTSVRVESCATNIYTSLDNAAFNELRSPDKEKVIVRFFLQKSFYFRVFKTFYLWHLRRTDPGAETPPFFRDLYGAGLPFAGMTTLGRMIADADRWQRGHAYFGHIILPHQPYVFDASCNILTPVLSWVGATGEVTGDRSEVYRRYFDQVRCTHRKIRDLFGRMKTAGIFQDALIVLHADHGSRIAPEKFFLHNRAQFDDRHLIDGYSSLFAARAPSLAKGYSPRLAPLPTLLREFALGLEPQAEPEAPPAVFLWSDERRRKGVPQRARLPFEFPAPGEG